MPAPKTPSSTMPQTGDGFPVLLIALVGVAGATAVGAGAYLHHRKGKGVISDEPTEVEK